jgi:hypothetical protein
LVLNGFAVIALIAASLEIVKTLLLLAAWSAPGERSNGSAIETFEGPALPLLYLYSLVLVIPPARAAMYSLT